MIELFENKEIYYCSKLNKICIAKLICAENPDIPKLEECYKNLKQQSLFDYPDNHNQ